MLESGVVRPRQEASKHQRWVSLSIRNKKGSTNQFGWLQASARILGLEAGT